MRGWRGGAVAAAGAIVGVVVLSKRKTVGSADGSAGTTIENACPQERQVARKRPALPLLRTMGCWQYGQAIDMAAI
jgi:hypothetical protein